jgi:c-di-GMP-binding flagellar brake protein YcgR
MANGRPAILTDNAQCVIRMVSAGVAIGFRANIECIQTTPFPLIIFSYPREYQEIVIRQRERIDCCIESLLLPKDWLAEGTVASGETPEADVMPRLPTEPYFSAVVDLSTGGCQVAIPYIDPLVSNEDAFPELRRQVAASQEMFYRSSRLQSIFTKGRVCELSCELPAPAEMSFEKIPVETRWMTKSQHSLLLGLKFTTPVPGLQQAVQELIEFQLKYFKRPVKPM